MLDAFVKQLENFAKTTLIFTLLKLLATFLLVAIGYKIINWIVKKLNDAKLKKDMDKTARAFIISFCSLALKILLIITAAAILGVPMTSIIAIIGSAGLAIGLALQGGLSNIAGGIILLVTKPFAVGDYILVKDLELDGSVVEIGVMYTKLVTPDNKKIVIPNSKVTSSAVVDHNSFSSRRLDMSFSVSCSSDIDKVKSVLLAIAAGDEMVLDEPAPMVILEKQSGGALVFMIRWWIKTEDYWTVYFALPEKVKKAFDKNGIEVPLPQLDVHFGSGNKDILNKEKKEMEK